MTRLTLIAALVACAAAAVAPVAQAAATQTPTTSPTPSPTVPAPETQTPTTSPTPSPTAETQTPTTSPTPSPTVPQPPLATFKKCPTPYQLGTKYDDIGYIVALTYDSQNQVPKCEAPGTDNGPPGGPVDANFLDTQNIISCKQQDVDGTNYNFHLNTPDGVMYCHVFWPQIESSDESPKYDCNVHGSEQKACVPPNPPPPPNPVPQPPLAQFKKCPTPYQLGTKYDDIGYIVALTYDSQDQ